MPGTRRAGPVLAKALRECIKGHHHQVWYVEHVHNACGNLGDKLHLLVWHARHGLT